jgi:hypothetical protein
MKIIFYWFEKIGQYGTAISNIASVAKSEFEKIHPEWFQDNQSKTQNLDSEN